MSRINTLEQQIKSTTSDFSTVAEKFTKSCLVYNKHTGTRGYGILIAEAPVRDSEIPVLVAIKVLPSQSVGMKEFAMQLYISEKAPKIPNVQHLYCIYTGGKPSVYEFVKNASNEIANVDICKGDSSLERINDVFGASEYYYVVMPLCNASLLAYLGRLGNKLTHLQFVTFVFQIIVGLQTVQALGIFHNDVKHANFVVCDSEPGVDELVYIDDATLSAWRVDYAATGRKVVKIIDFGEARVVGTEVQPCAEGSEMSNEIRHSLRLVLEFVANSTPTTGPAYRQLLDMLKECTTDLKEVLQSDFFECLRVSSSVKGVSLL